MYCTLVTLYYKHGALFLLQHPTLNSMSNTAFWYRQQHSTVLYAHLTNGRLHVQLLQHRVHVARGSCIAQTHKPALCSANDRRMELEGREGGEGRERRREEEDTTTQCGGVPHSNHSPHLTVRLQKYTKLTRDILSYRSNILSY